MDFATFVCAIVGIVAVFGMPIWITALIVRHRQRMAEIAEARASGGVSAMEIARLGEEIAQLRDTTTKYDLSVENALQELGRRLEVVERATQSDPPLRETESAQAAHHVSREPEPQEITRRTGG